MRSNQYLKTTIRQPPINQKLINTFVIVVYIQINSSSRSYSGIKKIRKTVTKTVLKICKMSHLFLNYKKMLDGIYVSNETFKANFPTLRFCHSRKNEMCRRDEKPQFDDENHSHGSFCCLKKYFC